MKGRRGRGRLRKGWGRGADFVFPLPQGFPSYLSINKLSQKTVFNIIFCILSK